MKRNGHSADASSLRVVINNLSAGGFVGFYAKVFLYVQYKGGSKKGINRIV